MFGLFKRDKNQCPISEDTRIWMENAIIWLINQFGEKKILTVKTLLPTPEDFPTSLEGTETDAFNILNILTQQMDIDPANIKIEFYDQGLFELSGDTGTIVHSQQYEDEQYSSGLYLGKNSEGKFIIAIERAQLKLSDKLVATIAHELSHIKILGEDRLQDNDEYLTDLVTVFFGLGIFNANSAFQFKSDFNSWSYSKQGYLIQQEWGYALALYAYIRQEKTPFWINYLNPNVRSDFLKSENYI